MQPKVRELLPSQDSFYQLALGILKIFPDHIVLVGHDAGLPKLPAHLRLHHIAHVEDPRRDEFLKNRILNDLYLL